METRITSAVSVDVRLTGHRCTTKTQIRKDNMLISAAGKANMIISLMVLHDKFGYGEKRLNKFINEYQKQLEAYNSGYVESVNDFTTVLKEECGIEIK